MLKVTKDVKIPCDDAFDQDFKLRARIQFSLKSSDS